MFAFIWNNLSSLALNNYFELPCFCIDFNINSSIDPCLENVSPYILGSEPFISYASSDSICMITWICKNC